MRKLTADDDFSFGASQLDFYRDEPAAVGQAAKTRLLLWLGEWFLDLLQGTPYMLGVLGKHSQATADVTIQDRILNTQGMVDIESFESEVDSTTRGFSATATINTIYGPTKLEVANRVNF